MMRSPGRGLVHFEDKVTAGAEIPRLDDNREALLLQDIGNPFRPSAVGRCVADEEIRHEMIPANGPNRLLDLSDACSI